jgi:hypothetical protein
VSRDATPDQAQDMADQVFTNRLNRIHKRHKQGKPVDLLAGPGELRHMRFEPGAREVPLGIMLASAVSGFVALSYARDHLAAGDLRALVEDRQALASLAQAHPQLVAALVCLAAIGLAFGLAVLLRRRIGIRLHAFGFAGAAGLVAQQAHEMADPAALAAFIGQLFG